MREIFLGRGACGCKAPQGSGAGWLGVCSLRRLQMLWSSASRLKWSSDVPSWFRIWCEPLFSIHKDSIDSMMFLCSKPSAAKKIAGAPADFSPSMRLAAALASLLYSRWAWSPWRVGATHWFLKWQIWDWSLTYAINIYVDMWSSFTTDFHRCSHTYIYIHIYIYIYIHIYILYIYI